MDEVNVILLNISHSSLTGGKRRESLSQVIIIVSFYYAEQDNTVVCKMIVIHTDQYIHGTRSHTFLKKKK